MHFFYSVVTTTYNDEHNIWTFLEEITSQNLCPQEVVIVDGGSTDRTVSIISEFVKTSEIPIVCVSGKRLNIAEGYNLAIQTAKSEYIGIVGTGNRYGPQFFERLMNEIECNDSDVAYAPIRGDDFNLFSRIYNRTFLNGRRGLKIPIASNHGALIKKRVFDDLGYFFEGFIYAGEDAEFYKRVMRSEYKMRIVDEIYVCWETPRNYNEFKKQVKYYTIANMQIDWREELRGIVRYLIVVIGVILFAFFAVAIQFASVSMVYKSFAIVALCAMIVCLGKRLCFLRVIKGFLKLYFFISNVEYAKKEYSIKGV